MANGDKLTDEAKAFVVQALACWDSPATVAKAVKDDFDITVTRQAIEAYDPTKRAGQTLAEPWRELFEATRKAFIEDTASIGVANRAARLRRLDRMAGEAERMRNYALAAQLLEQAAKECGNAFTNRRELTGKDGAPIQADIVARPDLTALDQAGRDGLRAAIRQLVGGPGGDAPGA